MVVPSKLELQILQPLSWPEQIAKQIALGLRSLGIFITLIPVGITLIAGYILTRLVDIKNSTILKDLKGTDIVQINATVIAGVLIVLTIGNLLQTHKDVALTLLTASIIYPFAISSIGTLQVGKVSPRLGLNMMIAGFIYLMVAVVLLPFLVIVPETT